MSRPADQTLDDALDDAVAAAGGAERRAGVRLRELTEFGELQAVCRLYNGIWPSDPSDPPINTELLRALTKAGNYAGGAYDGDTLVGACVGFFGPPADRAMHSHIAGVGAGAAGRGVGYALKLHQRAWALARGVRTVSWTFDPLVRRNAYFNLVKLAATAVEYLPNFYGGALDAVNGADESDRLLVHWELAAGPVTAACAGTPRHVDARAAGSAGAVIGLDHGDDGGPVPGSLDGETVLVAVPPDIETLRRTDPARATHWRLAMREVLGELMAEGARPTGFDRAGWYVVTRGDAGREQR
jgi:predicted GNAT superfamily acetyltransferase